MAYYLVKAKPKGDMQSLKTWLDSGEIKKMRPFGTALDYSLNNARLSPGDWVVWEEEDYCVPPLAQERAAVLDKYFSDLAVQTVKQGDGWKRIEELPGLWK